MKKSIITSVLLLASLISCNTTKQLSNEELDRISWSAFCKDFGYNEQADRDNEQAINGCYCTLLNRYVEHTKEPPCSNPIKSDKK